MPPEGRLADAEIEGIRAWIDAGAHLPEGGAVAVREDDFDLEARAQHWSFQPIADPPPPAVRDLRWAADPIDTFILASLEDAGLQPAPAAAPEAWLRRVTFALTGLPPTPQEVEAFLSSPGNRRSVVQRLLASPRFGEAWARHWLDLVRYAARLGLIDIDLWKE